MPVVRTLHNRGANIVIAASAEVLFTPTGDVGRWSRSLTYSARRYAAEAAPINKRPRWAHYGKPLKQTMRSTTKYRPNELRVFSAVGSTAPHAYYVDQGTQDFMAKILPPWTRGGASLYEHTWKPSYNSQPVGEIAVRGQAGQHFFDKGLDRAFAQAHLLDTVVPGGPRMAAAERALPSGIADFLGNTPWSVAFQFQLEQWRAWRDAAYRSSMAFHDDGAFARRRAAATRLRGEKTRRPTVSPETKREQSRKRTAKYRAANREALNAKRRKSLEKPINDKGDRGKRLFDSVAEKNAVALTAFLHRNKTAYVISKGNGFVVIGRRGRPGGVKIPYASMYSLI